VRIGVPIAIAIIAVSALVSDGWAAPRLGDRAEPSDGLRTSRRAALVDPLRWRARISLSAGAGGGGDGHGHVVTMHPVRLEVGVVLYRQLSLVAAAGGILATVVDDACGAQRAPHAAVGTLGLRADLWNGKSSPWAVPFVEAWAGVGGQPRGDRESAVCERLAPFATGGARLGLDAWLGRVAVTVAVSYDHLPRLAPISFSIGATTIVW
jgi:hypothetical protein